MVVETDEGIVTKRIRGTEDADIMLGENKA